MKVTGFESYLSTGVPFKFDYGTDVENFIYLYDSDEIVFTQALWYQLSGEWGFNPDMLVKSLTGTNNKFAKVNYTSDGAKKYVTEFYNKKRFSFPETSPVLDLNIGIYAHPHGFSSFLPHRKEKCLNFTFEGVTKKQESKFDGIFRSLNMWRFDKEGTLPLVNEILDIISPSNYKLKLGKPCRLSAYDCLDYPTVVTKWHDEIPILFLNNHLKKMIYLALFMLEEKLEHESQCQMLRDHNNEHAIILIEDFISNYEDLVRVKKLVDLLFKSSQIIVNSHIDSVSKTQLSLVKDFSIFEGASNE